MNIIHKNNKLYWKCNVVKLSKQLDNGKESHLCITSDEEIKDGDFIIASSSVYWYNPKQKENNTKKPSISILFREDKKIIATTDKALTEEHDDNVPYPKMRSTSVGLIQQSFIELFVKKGGIDEVLVEVECYSRFILADMSKEPDNERDTISKLYKPLVNQDNTVNIEPVGEPLENRLWEWLSKNDYLSDKREILEKDYNNWIKENL